MHGERSVKPPVSLLAVGEVGVDAGVADLLLRERGHAPPAHLPRLGDAQVPPRQLLHQRGRHRQAVEPLPASDWTLYPEHAGGAAAPGPPDLEHEAQLQDVRRNCHRRLRTTPGREVTVDHHGRGLRLRGVRTGIPVQN
jgi:hypothetical protein